MLVFYSEIVANYIANNFTTKMTYGINANKKIVTNIHTKIVNGLTFRPKKSLSNNLL